MRTGLSRCKQKNPPGRKNLRILAQGPGDGLVLDETGRSRFAPTLRRAQKIPIVEVADAHLQSAPSVKPEMNAASRFIQ